MNNGWLSPQTGQQTAFLESEADIVIYGGAAGGGKTYGLLLLGAGTMLRAKRANCILFRRRAIDLHSAGGVWSEASYLYPPLGMTPVRQPYAKWHAPNGSVLQMAGMQLESDKDNYKGSQFDLIMFDELTQFSASQFWFLVGRARSASGNVRPFVRCATNPEPNWVCDLIRWWLTEDGYADMSKSGKIRWFFRHENYIHWADTEARCWELIHEAGIARTHYPQSLTFIPAKLDDNQILMRNDPRYIARLSSLDTLDRKRLLEGNWFVKPVGKLFRQEDFGVFINIPHDVDLKIITVDTAQQTKTANDYTVCQYWARANNRVYLLDQIRGKLDFTQQVQVIKNLAAQYRPHYILVEQAANGLPILHTLRKESGLPIITITRNKDKYQRAIEIQGYIQAGYVFLNPAAPYYQELMSELTVFSEDERERRRLGMHDDQVDCLVDAIKYLLYNKISAPESAQQDRRPPQGDQWPYHGQQPTTRPLIHSIVERRKT